MDPVCAGEDPDHVCRSGEGMAGAVGLWGSRKREGVEVRSDLDSGGPLVLGVLGSALEMGNGNCSTGLKHDKGGLGDEVWETSPLNVMLLSAPAALDDEPTSCPILLRFVSPLSGSSV